MVAALMLLGSLGCSSGDDDPPEEAAPSTPSTAEVGPTASVEHEPEAQARAEAIVLEPADVPEGWSPQEGAGIDDVVDEVRACLAIDPGEGEIGRASGPGYQHVDETGGVVAITSDTRVYESVAQAEAVVAAWAADETTACLDYQIRESITAAEVDGELERLEVDLPVDEGTGIGGAFVLTGTEAGQVFELGVQLVVMRTGDTVTIFRATSQMATLDPDVVATALHALADRHGA